jgi:hypothetical protein
LPMGHVDDRLNVAVVLEIARAWRARAHDQ